VSDEDDRRIGDYLMGELPPEEREQMERALREQPPLRKRMEGLEAVTSMLESLPDAAWEAARAQSTPPVETRLPRTRLAGRMRPALAAFACVLLLAVGVGIGVLIERPATPTGTAVVLHSLGGRSPSERATARMTASGRMTVSVEDLPATGPHRFYELWLMNSRTSLVAVASFRVDAAGRAELDVPLPVSPSGYRYLDISLQQADAGPAHSGNSVLRAPIRS
jgi:anti-sigma-K factor RskA